MTRVDAVVVGAGSRGRDTFGAWALRHPERLRIVAVVEPDDERRAVFGDRHGLADSARLRTADEAVEVEADAWIVASPDRTHADVARHAIGTVEAVLLEKPIASTASECVDLVHRAEEAGTRLHVAHVLRHTPFFQTVREVVGSGVLGELITVRHEENVVAWHMAHSFVRGNWARTGTSSPMIVQKCCHDFDALSWIIGSRFKRVASFGSLAEFRPDRAPPGATRRCTDGCPAGDTCPFDARRIYLDPARTGWPVNVVTLDTTAAGIRTALETGPYGVCVYEAGSDVVDHQVAALEFENGVTATLTMHGHAPREERTMRYEGSRATLRAVFGAESRIEIIDHVHGRVRPVPVGSASGGHGGGDDGLISDFVADVAAGSGGEPPTARSVLEGHLAAFAAEEARLSGEVVEMGAFRRRAGAVDR